MIDKVQKVWTRPPFVGSWFIEQGDRRQSIHHGQITASIGDGFFLAVLFEMLTGTQANEHIYHVSEFASSHDNGLKRFKFFDSRDWYVSYCEAYQHYTDENVFNDQEREAAE